MMSEGEERLTNKITAERTDFKFESRCPFAGAPTPYCYISDMRRWRMSAMYYCGCNFERCRIYKRQKSLEEFSTLVSKGYKYS